MFKVLALVIGYALTPVPTAWPGDLVWAKYYDDYRFVAVRGLGTDYAFEADATAASHASAVGLLTGMYTGSGYEAYYYDGEGREIQRRATGYNRGRRSSVYNYDGSLARQEFTYPPSSGLNDMKKFYTYDSCGRLTSSVVRVSKARRVDIPIVSLASSSSSSSASASSSSSATLPGSGILPSMWVEASLTREYDTVGRLARINHGSGAAVTSYGYDVHGWLVSQYTTYGTGTDASSIGYTLEYAPCYNGNIARRVWSEGSYAYTYDALNRLTSAVFTPVEELADRPAIERDRIPDFSVYYDYDRRGNTTNVVRYGVVDAVSDFDRVETFGTLDELACSYDGNQLCNITAITEALPFDGVTGLHANGEFELSYNDAGDLVSDASRGLLYTRWNADGHPMQYDLEGGHRHYLYWDGLGNHLYTSYETSVAPVSAGMRPGRTRRTSLRAYCGDGHVLRGGAGNSAADTLEMIRFAGGYFDGQLTPHYYVTDYLGSNIAVIDADGTLVQSVTYYPYGEPHRDPAASTGIGIAGPEQQTASATFSNPYLYGGKEYVRRDGLREYIYGARMCVPAVTRFNSMDKLCEKHPDQSPYLFCGGNPIRFGDDSGNDYHVKVNHEEQTITISADYYAYKSDAESVTAAIGFWNNLSGQYTMDGYTINFALTYHEVEPYKTPNGEELEQRSSINLAMGGDSSANAYMVIHDGDDSPKINEDGKASSGGYKDRQISVSERNSVGLTGAHEVGHSLGLLHSDYGLMYPLGNSYRRTSDVSKSEIKAMLKQAFIGKVPKDDKDAEPGKGYLDNEAEIKKIKWNYEVKKK